MNPFGQPERDRRIREALQRRERPSAGDDAALTARVLRAAEPLLSERRQASAPWWQWTAAWARFAVPVGLAATLAAGILLVRSGEPPTAAGEEIAAAEEITESALVLGWNGGGGRAELAGALVEPATDAWLLAEASGR